MFVELVILLRDAPNAAIAQAALRRSATHRVEPLAHGVVVVAAADAARRIEFSFGTTSIYDDAEWLATVAAADPAGWQRAQPVVHQVDVNGRSLEREDLAAAYAAAFELAAHSGGMVWDAITERPVGDDPAAAAERCAAALEDAEAAYAENRSGRGLLARIFGR